MIRVHDEHQLVLVERELLDLGIVERTQEPDGDLLALDQLDHLLGVAGAHGHLHARVRLREAVEDRRQRVRRHDRRRAHGDVPGHAAAQLAEDEPALVHRLQGALRVGEERAARFRQAHASAAPHEQPGADVPLERVEPRRERRLRDVQRLRRSGHGPAPDDLRRAPRADDA